MRSEKPDLSSINHIYCNVLRTVSSYSGSVQGSLYSRKERSNRAVHVCVLREFLYRKNSCRLQGGNSTSENALAGCKREIPPRIMPLQVARGKFHHGKCSCRLQEENRSTGNALAGCKRKIAQPKMLLQVAREKSLNRKCPCRLQEENSTMENALAGCKRKIAQPEMLLQVAREKSLNRKCSCRLQEKNRSTENALAGCKRKIAQPKMPLQVAREESLNRKCNNIVVIPRGLQSPHPWGSFAYVSLRNHWNIAIRRQMFTLCMVQIHRKRVRHSW